MTAVSLGRCGVLKTLMQYQFECELLQTFLAANRQCAAVGVVIEHVLHSRHCTHHPESSEDYPHF